MPKRVPVVRSIFCVAALALAATPGSAFAVEEAPAQEAPAQEAPAQEAPAQKAPPEKLNVPEGLECSGQPVSGSGPGFADSREKSEQAAINDWLAKARAVYDEADWDTAFDKKMGCAKQGLYSKCFIDAVPCRPKAGASQESAKGN